ncbi:MAG: TauD/TfdA family dioxygenase [Planctomycetota bacterium]
MSGTRSTYTEAPPLPAPDACLEELLELVARTPGLAREPEGLLELRAELPETARFSRALRRRVEGDDGFVRIAFEGLPSAYHRLAFAAVGALYAAPILRYGLLYEVADRGESYLEKAIPVSMTRATTGMHTDSSAFDCVPGTVALLCERPSDTGGESRVVDARAACDALREESPEHFARLQRPFVRDVVTPGLDKGLDSLRRNRFPVVRTEPEFEFRYMRYWIEKGAGRLGRALEPEDLAAFDALDRVLDRDDFATTFRLLEGEAVFVDNRRCAHGRNAYEVDDGAPIGRRLWRMWLDERSPLAPARPTALRALSG